MSAPENLIRRMSLKVESLPLTEKFSIARGAKTSAETVVVTLSQNGKTGRGEAVPYERYGENIETVTATIEQLQPVLEGGLTRENLQNALLPGAARNAIDCALWDLETQLDGVSVWERMNAAPPPPPPRPRPLTTSYTISLDTPAAMADKARKAHNYPLLKVKLGGADGLAADLGRLSAIHAARPDAKIMIDVNEGWQADELQRHAEQLRQYDLLLIEQPLREEQDAVLSAIDLPFCADESVHDRDTLAKLADKYRWINIKLDKSGGLTEALALAAAAKQQGFKVMVGCMVSSSLSMMPAFLLAQNCDLVDLDAPLFLRHDRQGGLIYGAQGQVTLPAQDVCLWGWTR